MDAPRFRTGSIVYLTEEARQRRIGSNWSPERKGVVLRFDGRGLPVVRWSGNKSASTYHPSFLKSVDGLRGPDLSKLNHMIKAWEGARYAGKCT